MEQRASEGSDRPLFKGLITGDIGALAKATDKDLQDISEATQVSMPVDEFASMVKNWMATAKHPRFDRPYPQMVYQPMLEVSKYLRDNGYRTYIVTGGGQDSCALIRDRYMAPPRPIFASRVTKSPARYSVARSLLGSESLRSAGHYCYRVAGGRLDGLQIIRFVISVEEYF